MRQRRRLRGDGSALPAAAAAVIAAAALAAVLLPPIQLPAQAQDLLFEQVERGRYLTAAGDCQACHTTPGGTPFAGGRPIETPFGAVVSPNLTPDQETGIGAWTSAEFVRAVRYGVARDGTHLFPALPYPYFTKASDADVRAIRAYLATLEPVRNPVEANQLPFPFSIRAGMIAWNALNFSSGAFEPRPDRDAQWNRGAYLVDGLGHCGACHTPKDLTGGDQAGRYLQGNVIQAWNAPGITGDPQRGIGAWTNGEIVEYLKTGRNAYAAASGPMAEVVQVSTSGMTDEDLGAIAAYLKTVPGPSEPPPAPLPSDQPAMQAGAAIFRDQCAACHTQAGIGVPRMFPALKGSPQVQAGAPATLLRVVLQGARSAATDAAPSASAMPAFGWKLDDAEVAAVVTYIRNAWGNAAPAVSEGDARRMRNELAARTD